MGEIGVAAQAIPVGVRMGPVWPAGVCGSITHAGGLCAAIAARNTAAAGLGIDVVELEEAGAMLVASGSLIADEAELDAARSALGEQAAAILFSAKESAIKAMSARLDRFVDFTEVGVRFEGSGFGARCEAFGSLAEGWWTICEGYGFTSAVRR